MLYYKVNNLTEGGNFMEDKKPRMLTVRETAKTGILPEHSIRLLLKAGKLPAMYVGKNALINYDNLCQQLSELSGIGLTKRDMMNEDAG